MAIPKAKPVTVCTVCGSVNSSVRFASKTERAYYEYLVRHGARNVEPHPAFLLPGGVRVTADFRYSLGGRVYVDDVKPLPRGEKAMRAFLRTDRWRRFVRDAKQVHAIHGVVIRPVGFDPKTSQARVIGEQGDEHRTTGRSLPRSG